MELKEIADNWNQFGARDPMWAILADPTKRGGKWDPDQFFATGRDEIRGVLEWMASLGLSVNTTRALDFGCGLGRLSQGLGDHFAEVDGVDIAPSMIERARGFNRHGARCRYHVNGANDLGLFADATFDFIYCVIVLQHMPAPLSTNYLREFLRVLAPGGVLVFQVPARLITRTDQPAEAQDHVTFAFSDMGTAAPLRMEMFGLPRPEVEGLIRQGGGTIRQVKPDQWAGPSWESYFYVVTR